MNVRDSEVIAGLLLGAGYELTEDEKKADIVIFNTCSVRQHAEDKVFSEVGRISKARSRSKPATRNQRPATNKSKPIIGIVGCMAQNYKETIFERSPFVDFAVGPADIHKIPEIIQELAKQQELFEKKIWETEGQTRPEEIYHTGFYEDKEHAYVVISEGCSNYCSYCVVPYVRGESRNRNYKDILREIAKAAAKGITKITLLGQNVNSYEYEGVNFAKLLQLVNDIEGIKEVGFITSHPKDTSVELFKAMAGLEKMKKILHLPLQSGSDKILKLMNRGYTKGQYLDLVESYRRIVPGGRLSTDIIVGFPTESREDFSETYEMMKKINFDSAYIFKYSPRPNTQAQHLPDDVPKEEKERRHKVLLDFQKELWRKHLKLALVFLAASCIFISQVSLSWAMLDIFDHPQELDRKEKIVKTENQAGLLDYPKECILRGEYEEAYKTCQKLIAYPAAQKFKGEVLYFTGLSCLKLGRFVEARSYFNDILLVENQKEGLKIDASIGIADAYFSEEKFDKALDAYKQILASYPDTPFGAMIYYKLAQITYQTGRQEESSRYLDTVIQEFPLSFEARLARDFQNKANSCETRAADSASYAVQVGCFNEKDNADSTCEKLVRQGFEAYISESQGKDEPRFRVKVGKFDSKDKAETLEGKLKKAGYATKICP